MLIQADGSYGPCAVMLRGTAGVQSGYSGCTLGYSRRTVGVHSGYSQSVYNRDTVRVQLGGYSQGTAGGTVRVQWGYSHGTAGVQSGYSRGTVGYSGYH